MKQICIAFLFGFSFAAFLLMFLIKNAYNLWGCSLLSEDVYDLLAAGVRDYYDAIEIIVVTIFSFSFVLTASYIGDALNKKDKADNLPPTGLYY